MVLADKILKLAKQLYPTGRAFRMFKESELEMLNKALADSEARAYADAVSILDSALPDNQNFTAQDASDWERRLGLITNEAVSLINRKLAIIRKINHPGEIKARQNYLYLEGQLQSAGFNVYVHENRFSNGMGGYITRTPEEVSGLPGSFFQHGDIQHGDIQHGRAPGSIVANHINEAQDSIFNLGSNLRCTFFIGASYLGDYADVEIERKDEFRQLILRIKPVQAVGFLFINYV